MENLPINDVERHYRTGPDFDPYENLMEIYSHCNRFERRGDFDVFSMADYQSCENCRHLGPGDRCMIK